MELKSMELSKDEKDDYPETAIADKPKYPYGLRISLDKDSLEKLGLKTLPEVGARVMITAEACVVSINQYQGQEGDEYKSVELQIEEMGLGTASKDHAGSLYGDDED